MYALGALVLSACGGGGTDSGEELFTCNSPLVIDETGTSCVEPPPLQCPGSLVPNEANNACVPPVDPSLPPPSITPEVNQALIFYNRPDGNYEGWTLHVWNNGQCDAYTEEQANITWTAGVQIAGVDPNYGAYWLLDLKDGHDDCGNYIIHLEDEKEQGGADKIMDLSTDRINYVLSGVNDTFPTPILSLGVTISGSAAHWISRDTLVWDYDSSAASSVKLHYGGSGELDFDAEAGVTSGSNTEMTATTAGETLLADKPHLSGLNAFSVSMSDDEVKAALKGELLAVAYDESGAPSAATRVQFPFVLDDLYTSGANDADEAELGIIYDGGNVTAKLWAPTARSVNLKVYNADKSLASTETMSLDAATGIWSFSGGSELDRQFYRYEVEVYHYATDAIETVEATDPYSVSLSTNGRYSQFVNLDDADLKPAGWDGHAVPTIAYPEDAVLYEGHIRDFSALDTSVSAENRGKYLAFTEENSVPVRYLKDMAEAGVTHFHMLPANDIASINEDVSQVVDLYSTVADLCALNSSAPVCGVEDDSATLLSVMESYDPSTGDAQALVQSMRGYDQFNWGYDPHHFNAPEGSYSSDPDGVARILEMRAMNMALHEMGLRVVLDVVYNHTASSGLNDNSVFDKVVPGYYHRLNVKSGNIERSTCCENIAVEHKMLTKFMSDSLVLWAEQYGFDSFRFDIMGHIPKQAILDARDAVQAIDPDNYFYGEGWNFGEVVDNSRFEQATQANMAGTEVGSFNDRFRESIRGADLFKEDGNASQYDFLRISLAATLTDYVLEDQTGTASLASAISWNGSPAGYATDPADIINYVSKHDNETLWDKLQYGLPDTMTIDDRVRSQNIAASIGLVSQGIPFFQFGGDFIRSKSMDRNTYDAGDWFNQVDFSLASHGWNRGLPLAEDNASAWTAISELIANPETALDLEHLSFAADVFKEYLMIRRDSPLFRLRTGADVIERVGFHNVGARQTRGLIVMSIDDGAGLVDLDPANDAIVVLINGTGEEQTHAVPTAAGFELHSIQQTSIDTVVRSASFADGSFTVPARTMAVFVKPQGEAQGEGLAADATTGAADVVPYGSTEVFVRGEMNGWSEDNPFTYNGDGVYTAEISLDAGSYQFKFASADWSTVDFGAVEGEEAVVLGEGKTLVATGANMSVTIEQADTYVFRIDAVDPTAPVLTVDQKRPFADNTILLRGSLNGWDASTPFTYIGNGLYQVEFVITAGSYEFKVATEDWSTVDFGAFEGDEAVTLQAAKRLNEKGANIQMEIVEDTTLVFIVDGSFPANPTISVSIAGDFDQDGIADSEDEDRDNDGVNDSEDAFPYNAAETTDTDGDGIGDNEDAFPEDATEQFDSDGDGVGDNAQGNDGEDSEPVEPGGVPYGETEVLLRGDMNGWDESTALVYRDNGVYGVEVTLAAGTYGFKLASADWSTVDLGALEGEELVEVGVAKTLTGAGANLSLTLEEETTLVFMLDASDSAAPVLTVRDAVPYGDTGVLLRGDMNGWDESTELTYIGDGVYEVSVELTAGNYGFKIASSDWSTVNFGALSADDAAVELGVAEALARTNDNLSLDISADGIYVFTVDAFNPEVPVLTVNNAVPYGDTTVLLRGDMNGWDESTAFSYLGEGVYEVSVDLLAGSYGFKVASADWATVNFGAVSAEDAAVELGVAEALAESNDNLSLVLEADGTYIFSIDASVPGAPLLTVRNAVPYGATTVLLRGDMNGWDESTAFSYIGSDTYEVTVDLVAGTYGFKVASADWSTVNYGAVDADSAAVELGVALTLAQTNDNLSLVIAEDGPYTFSVDASDPTSPVLTVKSALPYGTTAVLLRGDMNGWDESTAFAFVGDNTYRVTVALAAGNYGFKVASADWSTVNYGASSADDAAVVLGEAKTLAQTNDNLSLTLEADTTVVFEVDATDPAAPVLTAYNAEMYAGETILLRGDMNGWDESTAFTYNGDGSYSVDVDLEVGSYGFKVATADWSTVNLGAAAATAVELDTALGLAANSQSNLSIDIVEDGSYRFTVTGPDPDAPSVTVTRN